MRPRFMALDRDMNRRSHRGGGSNGSRLSLSKIELPHLADKTAVAFQAYHYPPETSKRTRIEHRLCCRMTQSWRRKPLRKL